jgi:hypothetical protein
MRFGRASSKPMRVGVSAPLRIFLLVLQLLSSIVDSRFFLCLHRCAVGSAEATEAKEARRGALRQSQLHASSTIVDCRKEFGEAEEEEEPKRPIKCVTDTARQSTRIVFLRFIKLSTCQLICHINNII